MLVVCTGNVCRSPTATLIFRQRLDSAGSDVSVVSAGLATEGGWPLDATVRRMLDELGVAGTEGHRSRLLRPDDVVSAELILTGTRAHRNRLGALHPEAYDRTFTLLEAAQLARRLPQEVVTSLPTAIPDRGRALVQALAQQRRLSAFGENVDLDDPIGGRPKAYRRMIELASGAVNELTDVLVPSSADVSRLRAP